MKIASNHIQIPPPAIKQLGQIKTSNATYPSRGQVPLINHPLSFGQILEKELIGKEKELTFSKHAVERLAERDIAFTPSQQKRLEDGVVEARDKGIQDSLILLDTMAMVVNVKNNVVITVMNQAEQRIYTNIDGAIIV